MSEKMTRGGFSEAMEATVFSSTRFSHVVLKVAPSLLTAVLRMPPAATPSASLWETILMGLPWSMWALSVWTAGCREPKKSSSEVIGDLFR